MFSSVFDSIAQEELQKDLVNKSMIPGKPWFTLGSLPFFKNKEVLFTRKVHPTDPCQSFNFLESGQIQQENFNVNLGVKYSNVVKAQWDCEGGNFLNLI